MRRPVKILLGVVAVGSFAALLAVAVTYRQARAEPEWYRVLTDLDGVDRSARAAEDKLVEARNWAAGVAAAEVRAARAAVPNAGRGTGAVGGGTAQTASVRAGPAISEEFEVRITGEELTASLMKWSRLQGWESAMTRYVESPVVAMHDGRVVVAGKVREVGSVLSLHYRPEVKDGRLRIVLERVTGGRLPLPAGVAEGQLARLRPMVDEGLKRWGADARLDSRGQANSALILYSGGLIARAVLSGEEMPAVMMLPVDDRRGLPVEVVRMQVMPGDRPEVPATLVIRARPVPRDQRDTLLHELRSGK